MSEKLDKIDLKILKILQENSKITNLDLSKKIGLSPAPTLERVKKLESSGIVESYHAMVNPQSIGLNVKTFVLVSLAWQKENALANFMEKIKSIEEITECYIITGEADFLIKAIAVIPGMKESEVRVVSIKDTAFSKPENVEIMAERPEHVVVHRGQLDFGVEISPYSSKHGSDEDNDYNSPFLTLTR